MKKISLLLILTLFLTPAFVSADQGLDDSDALVPPVGESSEPTSAQTATLVNMEPSKVNARFRELERRIVELERDGRFRDDRIRNLERTVEDLRRRN